ncbi:MAG: hypothetical protein ACM336_18270 [Acidobacteriota bacterium]
MVVTRRAVLFALPLATLAAQKRRKRQKLKPGTVEVAEISIHRESEQERLISIEGRIRNTGERPIKGLTLVFAIVAPGGEEVARQRGEIETDPFEPGAESEFHWQMKDHARAVQVRVGASDQEGFEVAVEKPGPYVIE